MSVLGVDLGTSFCVLATVQRGGLTIIRNDLSERLTPALVSFTENERLVGESAQSTMRSNFKNTCRHIKQLLGVTSADVAVIERERQFALAELAAAEGEATVGHGSPCLMGYAVQYRGENHVFTATRVLAALLAKLRDIAERYTGGPITDCVISVPGWFTESSRAAVLQAAALADLQCNRIMNEHSAVALDYGIFRSTTFEERKKQRVAFVSVGHATTSVFVVDYVRSDLDVVKFVAEKNLGGRDFDRCIVKYFADVFNQKHGVDPMKHPKMLLKLEEAASRAKKVLSANSEAPFNVECLWEENDISAIITRQEFEDLCAPHAERLRSLLRDVFSEPDTIHSIEIIGGCTRIPWVQSVIAESLNQRLSLSRTLNMDETVARGCALQAAIINPRYRVREFAVNDRLQAPVNVHWEVEGSVKDAELFAANSVVGNKKTLTFSHASDILLELRPVDQVPLVAAIKMPPTLQQIDPSVQKKVRVRTRVTGSGLLAVEEAFVVYEHEVAETIVTKKKVPISPQETATACPPQTGEDAHAISQPAGEDAATAPPDMADDPANAADAANAAHAQPPQSPKFREESVTEVVKRMKTERLECSIVLHPRVGFYTPEELQKHLSVERSMRAADKALEEARNTMNSLEAWVLETRSRLSGDLQPFVEADEARRILAKLDEAENWVYDNQGAPKDETAKYFEQIKSVCGGPGERYAVKVAAEEAQRKKEEAEAAAAAAAAAAADEPSTEKAMEDDNNLAATTGVTDVPSSVA